MVDNGINVHFSNHHVNYFTAWQYVTEEDDVLLSPDHPDLWNIGLLATDTSCMQDCSRGDERVPRTRNGN